MTDKTTCSHYRLKSQSSSRNNSHKLPLPLLDMLYQYNGGSKLSVNVVNKTNVLRALVNEYLLSTVGSDMFLLNKFVRMTGGHFVTVISLDGNELFMKKCPLVTDIIIFNIDMRLTTTTA